MNWTGLPNKLAPRSNPATYTDIFAFIRKLYSDMELSKLRRYSQSRFSFNLKGGRCEQCRGAGAEKLEMSFMPDLFVVCESCRGKRYNEPTLDVRYQGKNIAEVLDLSVREAIQFFSKLSFIRERLEILEAVGAESSRTLPLRANPGTLPHWPRAGGKLATPVREELRREPPKAEPSSPVIVHTERQSPRAAALAPSPGSRLPLLGGFCISWTPSARGLAFKRKPQPGTESR